MDMELTNDLRYKVLGKETDFPYFVELKYENLTDYCIFYNCIRHDVKICKKT